MSWTQLLNIVREARQEAKANRDAPLVACPFDGAPLEFRNGIANCPMGNFRSRARTRGEVNAS